MRKPKNLYEAVIAYENFKRYNTEAEIQKRVAAKLEQLAPALEAARRKTMAEVEKILSEIG